MLIFSINIRYIINYIVNKKFDIVLNINKERDKGRVNNGGTKEEGKMKKKRKE